MAGDPHIVGAIGPPAAAHRIGYGNSLDKVTVWFAALGELIAVGVALVGLVGLAGPPPRQWAVVTLGWFAVIALTLRRERRKFMHGLTASKASYE